MSINPEFKSLVESYVSLFENRPSPKNLTEVQKRAKSLFDPRIQRGDLNEKAKTIQKLINETEITVVTRDDRHTRRELNKIKNSINELTDNLLITTQEAPTVDRGGKRMAPAPVTSMEKSRSSVVREESAPPKQARVDEGPAVSESKKGKEAARKLSADQAGELKKFLSDLRSEMTGEIFDPKGRSVEDLEALLTSKGVNYKEWQKPTKELFKELEEGESILEVRGNDIYRHLCGVLNVSISRKSEDGTTFHLVETQQTYPNAPPRTRHQINYVSEKAKAKELQTPETLLAGVQRGTGEELDQDLSDMAFKFEGIEHMPKESDTFKGLKGTINLINAMCEFF